jgi:Tubulin-tyrosine ligase family
MNPEKPSKGFQYSYRLLREGNNEQLVEEVLQTRSWWRPALEETSQSHETANLIWKCGDMETQIDYEPLKAVSKSFETRVCAHKLPNTVEADAKSSSFRHLRAYCQEQGLDVFDFVPLTFSFRLDEAEFPKDLQIFAKVFKAVERGNSTDGLQPITVRIDEVLGEELPVYHEFQLPGLPPRTVHGRTFKNPEWGEFKLHDTFFGAATNMWILKPSRSDRGRGIEIFRSLEELELFLQMYVSGCRHPKYSDINYSDDAEASPSLIDGAISSDEQKKVVWEFVIQKYMEKPALIKGYKFDIRPHGLLSHDRKLYLFRELYGRAASHPFSTDKKNYFSHLTNWSVGVLSKNYDKVFAMNSITHQELVEHLSELLTKSQKTVTTGVLEFIFNEITKLVKLFHRSFYKDGKDILNPQEIPNVFEIFGYDIMLDETMHFWLIETNESPGIDDEGHNYFYEFFGRMLDDLFKLTIDEILPTPEEAQRTKQYYSFSNYPDDENLWVQIADYSNK